MTLFSIGKRQRRKEKNGFSKTLLIQESALVWIITIAFIVLAFICVINQFDPQFMWLSVLPTVAWTAYGVSQGFYYSKSKAENTEGGIVYETAMAGLEEQRNE